MRGWAICPVIGSGTEEDPFRAALADREATEGDRLEFVIALSHSSPCLVAYEVVDSSNFAALGAEEITETQAGLLGPQLIEEFDPAAYLGEADAPPSGSFVEDTFAGASGTLITAHEGEKGAKWTLGEGSVTTPKLDGSGYLVQGSSSSGYQYAYASGTPAGTDYSVQCGIEGLTSVKSGRLSGPMGRVSTSADTSYQFGWETGAGYELLKHVAGVVTSLGTYARVIVGVEEDTAILLMRGTAITGFVNGTERIAATDSSISAAGRVGVRVQGSTSVEAKIAYVIATDATAQEIPLGTSAGLSTATARLNAPTRLSLGSVAALSSASLALNAPTRLPLGSSAGLSSDALSLTAPTQIPLGMSSGSTMASLALNAPTQVILGLSSAATDASALFTAPTDIVLGSAAGLSSTILEIYAPILLAFQAVLAESGAALVLSAAVQVPLAATASSSSSLLALTAATQIPMDPAASLTSAALVLNAPPHINLDQSTEASAALLSLTAPTLLPLGATTGSGETSLMLSATTLISLAGVLGLSAARLELAAAAILALQQSAGLSSATLVLSTPPVIIGPRALMGSFGPSTTVRAPALAGAQGPQVAVPN